MTKTSATGFGTSSLGFEGQDALLRQTRGTESSSLTIAATQESNKTASMIYFGRITLYKRRKSDQLEMFTVGDA